MPAFDRGTARRWTAREVRQLIADSPLATPRYELVEHPMRTAERGYLA